MKDYLIKLIKRKQDERKALAEKIDKSESIEEVRSLSKSMETLKNEIDEAQDQLDKIEEERKASKKEKEERKVGEPTNEEVRGSQDWTKVDETNLRKVFTSKTIETEDRAKVELKEREERGKALKEGRAVTVSSSDILVPHHESNQLATVPFRQVSSFVDLTNTVNLNGGESYEEPFTISYGTAGTTEEGADYTEVEPTFGKVKINKVKITAYTEISEELEKLPNADYEAEVRKNIEISLKKKIAQQQIVGAGTTNTFVGIMSKVAENVCVLETDDLGLATIDDSTLDKIIFSYGGDEEVETQGVLVMNKADLLAFANVRDKNGNKVYNINLANQTINTVPYVINSNCKALSATPTEHTPFFSQFVIGFLITCFNECLCSLVLKAPWCGKLDLSSFFSIFGVIYSCDLINASSATCSTLPPAFSNSFNIPSNSLKSIWNL